MMNPVSAVRDRSESSDASSRSGRHHLHPGGYWIRPRRTLGIPVESASGYLVLP